MTMNGVETDTGGLHNAAQPAGVALLENSRGLDSILDYVFPRHCFVCGGITRMAIDFCPDCLRDLPRIEHACPRCGVESSNSRICGQCQQSPPAFRSCFAPFLYATPMDRLIQQIKFRQRLDLVRSAAGLMLAEMRNRPIPECLLPVPLHSSRLRARGFNQALEIARVLSRQLNASIATNAVSRLRATQAQSELPFAKRRANVKGVFGLKKPLAYQSIAIIDDVMTTGNTADSLARCLLSAGVDNVDVWVLART